MAYYRLVITFIMLFLLAVLDSSAIAADALPFEQSAQLRAGLYFPASKEFDVGNGIDLAYYYKPSPYTGLEAGIGYYRADAKDIYKGGFISAVPLSLTARAILPLQFITVNAGGGVGIYYKMLQLTPHNPPVGITETSADHSEVSYGYHATAGIEFPSSTGFSFLLDARYVFVDEGKFNDYDIKHDGAFVYGGFSLNF